MGSLLMLGRICPLRVTYRVEGCFETEIQNPHFGLGIKRLVGLPNKALMPSGPLHWFDTVALALLNNC